MHLNIKNDTAHRMAKELSRLTGESMTEAVTKAIESRLEHIRKTREQGRDEQIKTILTRAASRHILDERQGDDILYDEYGLPK